MNFYEEILKQFSTGEHLNLALAVSDAIPTDCVAISTEAAINLCVKNGDYVLMTSAYGREDISFIVCFKVCIENFSENMKAIAAVNTQVGNKFTENNLNCQEISIFKIIPGQVVKAVDLYNVTKLFRQTDVQTGNATAKSIQIPFRLVKEVNFNQRVAGKINPPPNTHNYSMVTYLCPFCGENMSKILINPMIADYGEIKDEYTRIVTCHSCNLLIAPFRNQNLSTGLCGMVQFDDNTYRSIIEYLDRNARF